MFHFNPSALAEYKSLFGHMTEPMALSVKDELNFQQEMESTEWTLTVFERIFSARIV